MKTIIYICVLTFLSILMTNLYVELKQTQHNLVKTIDHLEHRTLLLKDMTKYMKENRRRLDALDVNNKTKNIIKIGNLNES